MAAARSEFESKLFASSARSLSTIECRRHQACWPTSIGRGAKSDIDNKIANAIEQLTHEVRHADKHEDPNVRYKAQALMCSVQYRKTFEDIAAIATECSRQAR